MVEAEQVGPQLPASADPVVLLETLFTEMPIACVVANASGHCVVVNRAFCELFGSAPPYDHNIFQDELVTGIGLLPEIRRAFSGDRVAVPVFWYDLGKLHECTGSAGAEVERQPSTKLTGAGPRAAGAEVERQASTKLTGAGPREGRAEG
jgi:hypothetical protein